MPSKMGHSVSLETRKKISKTLMGHPISDKTRRVLAEKSPFKKGFTPWNKGKPWSEEMKKRISETNKRRGIKPKFRDNFPCGDRHPNWNGGVSLGIYSVDWTETLKRSIRERDNHICQICSQYGFDVHHIDYDKKNCNPNNLITLCHCCHAKINHNRDYWLDYFRMGGKIWA